MVDFILDTQIMCGQNRYTTGKIDLKYPGVAWTLKLFFPSILTNLRILEYDGNNSSYENVADPIIKLILKYGNHPSIPALRKVSKKRYTAALCLNFQGKWRNICKYLTFKFWCICQKIDIFISFKSIRHNGKF